MLPTQTEFVHFALTRPTLFVETKGSLFLVHTQFILLIQARQARPFEAVKASFLSLRPLDMMETAAS